MWHKTSPYSRLLDYCSKDFNFVTVPKDKQGDEAIMSLIMLELDGILLKMQIGSYIPC